MVVPAALASAVRAGAGALENSHSQCHGRYGCSPQPMTTCPPPLHGSRALPLPLPSTATPPSPPHSWRLPSSRGGRVAGSSDGRRVRLPSCHVDAHSGEGTIRQPWAGVKRVRSSACRSLREARREPLPGPALSCPAPNPGLPGLPSSPPGPPSMPCCHAVFPARPALEPASPPVESRFSTARLRL